jgi:hypothetical protein
MGDPIFVQRYHARKRLPAGRATAAHRGHDAEGRPVVVTVVRPADPDDFLRTMGVVSSVHHLDLAPVIDAGRDGPDCYVVSWDYGAADAATLTDAGFTVVVTQSPSDTVAAGTVVSQAPQPGVMASQGTTVSIVVSGGPPASTVTPTASGSP